jgi:hypothetical protein
VGGQPARTGVELSRETWSRLAWMDIYRRTRNVARTCCYFGISRQTFYRPGRSAMIPTIEQPGGAPLSSSPSMRRP